jgi:hypothetical protein
MLQGNTLENLSNKVTIRDSSACAVDEMLNYIYTRELPKTLSEELNLALLELSDMYGLEILKDFCGLIKSTRLEEEVEEEEEEEEEDEGAKCMHNSCKTAHKNGLPLFFALISKFRLN